MGVSFLDERQAKWLKQFLAKGMSSYMHKKSHRLIISWDISLIKSIKVHLNRLKIFLLYLYDAYDVNL